MDETKIIDTIAAELAKCTNCANRHHFIEVRKETLLLKHNSKSIDFKARFIRISAEQVAQGLTPQQWTNLAKEIIKARADLELT